VKLPPYAKQVQPHRGELRVYIGSDAWHNARIRNSYTNDSLALPDNEPPDGFTWPVRGASVLVLQAGGGGLERIPALAEALIRDGALIVRCAYGEHMATYRPARRDAA